MLAHPRAESPPNDQIANDALALFTGHRCFALASLRYIGGDSAQFLSAVKTLCGRRFPGQILADYPPPKADDPFTGKALEIHGRDCSENEI